MWKACGNLNKRLTERLCAAWVHTLVPPLRGNQLNRCLNCCDATCFCLFGIIWGIFLILEKLIHGFESGSEIGDVEGFTLGCDVGAVVSV